MRHLCGGGRSSTPERDGEGKLAPVCWGSSRKPPASAPGSIRRWGAWRFKAHPEPHGSLSHSTTCASVTPPCQATPLCVSAPAHLSLPPGSPMALSYPCQIPSPVIPWFKTFPFSPFMIRIVSSCPRSVTSEADCDTTALYLPFRLLSLSASRSVPFAIIIVSLRPPTFTAQLCLIRPFHPDPRPPFLFLSSCQILLPRILLKYKISHTLLYETAYNFKQNRSFTSLIQYTFQIPIFSTCLCFPRASGPRAKNKFAHLVKPSWAKGLLLKLLFFLGFITHQALRASPIFFLSHLNNAPRRLPEGRGCRVAGWLPGSGSAPGTCR